MIFHQVFWSNSKQKIIMTFSCCVSSHRLQNISITNINIIRIPTAYPCIIISKSMLSHINEIMREFRLHIVRYYMLLIPRTFGQIGENNAVFVYPFFFFFTSMDLCTILVYLSRNSYNHLARLIC